MRRGHGIEFSDYRKYEPGDNPRSIDWGVYARSDRLYIKRFQEEQDITLLILLDASASMGICRLNRKWSYARDFAIALAYVALMQQDLIILAVPGRAPQHFVGAKAIHSIADQAMKVRPAGNPDLIEVAKTAASRIRFPGMAVVISDFLMPLPQLYSIFNILRAKNLDIGAVQILSESDLQPWVQQQDGTFVDSETGEELDISFEAEGVESYRELLNKHNSRLSDFLIDSQIRQSQIRSGDAFDDALMDCLLESGLLQ